MTPGSSAVLLFGGRRTPRALRELPSVDITGTGDIDTAVGAARRLIVVGADADLAAVLTRLLRTERLDVEVGHARRGRHAGRLRGAPAHRVPLIRDETGAVLVGAGLWLPPAEQRTLTGEGVVDDTPLFDGEIAGVRIEPTDTAPGLRASALSPRMRPRRWVTGRAAQLGTTGALVVRDGVQLPRPVRRSTFYRHTEGWLRVR